LEPVELVVWLRLFKVVMEEILLLLAPQLQKIHQELELTHSKLMAVEVAAQVQLAQVL